MTRPIAFLFLLGLGLTALAGSGQQPTHAALKVFLNEDDAHVPIIFWGRGINRGTYAGRMNTVDIAPTLGVLLGVTPLSLIDGRARTDALAPRD